VSGVSRRDVPELLAMTAHESERDAFAQRLFGSALGYFDVLSTYLGLRLRLYDALTHGGAMTSSELGDRAGIAERYAREWLEQQATRGVLRADARVHPPRFSLPAGHAEVLLDRDSLAYAGGTVDQLMSLRLVVDRLVEAFRTGDGLPYEAYGSENEEGQGYSNRPLLLTTLPNEWLPALRDVNGRLASDPPAHVVDIGCGAGWSSIAIAKSYPGVTVDGFDADERSIEHARRNAAETGVSDRVRFHALGAEHAGTAGPVDFSLAIECIHDMARPVEALRAVREALVADGSMLVVDERTNQAFTGASDDREAYTYGWSVFTCLPTAMHERPSAQTGAVMRADTLRAYAEEAGFSRFEVLPIDHESFRLYLLRP
jgi:2-polyprenyl-3-methyl-5-hydroxy-6-metoxy-1,4-benzoquinol methylase